MFCISRSKAGCKKLHQVMIFFNLAHNTNTIRVQTTNCGISKRLKEHFLRKPCMVEVPNLVVMFLNEFLQLDLRAKMYTRFTNFGNF